jgi:hypothetical protein
VLKKRAEQIQEELSKEKEKTSKIREGQEDEISKLRAKLRQLQEENTTVDEVEIKKRIELEEQERARVADEQRKLEVYICLTFD